MQTQETAEILARRSKQILACSNLRFFRNIFLDTFMNTFNQKPFLRLMQGADFPLHALPQTINDACTEVQAATEAPAELIIAQCIGVAAAACPPVSG